MKRLALLTWICLLSMATQAQVVGGDTAELGEYPWMVALKKGQTMLCGATLIAPSWVLTAGHCGEGFPPFAPVPTLVGINVIDHNNPEPITEIIGIRSIFVHPDFDINSQSNGFDIALIKLHSPSTVTPVEIATLANGDALTTGGTDARVLGWGSINSNGDQSDLLKDGEVAIVDKDTCIELYANNSNSVVVSQGDRIICAGYTAGEIPAGAGAGDSGGPLIVDDNGQWVQIGVVSGGAETITTAGAPGLYTDVALYQEWIEETIAANTDNTSIGDPAQEGPGIEAIFSNNHLQLTMDNPQAKTYRIQITDAVGRSLMQQETMAQQGTIDLSVLSNGMYILSVSPTDNPSARYTRKFVR